MKFFWVKETPFYKKKKFYIPVILIVLFLIARAVLPGYLLKQTNKFLGTFSPQFILHIEDFDLNLLKGSYRFEKLTGVFRNNKAKFLDVDYVDVAISWKELWHERRIVTDIVLNEMDFHYFKDQSFEAAKGSKKEEATQAKDALFPLDVASVRLINSKFVFEGYPSLTENQNLTVSKLHGFVTNLTPTEKKKVSNFKLAANVFGPAPVNVEGHLHMLEKPLAFDADVVVKDFELPDINPFLWKKFPLTFNKGQLDAYSEVRSKEGKMDGYAKPFFKDLDIIKHDEQFKSVKHLFVEILTALGNLVLRNKDKTVATEFGFSFDKEFKVETDGIVKKAISNGFSEPLKPGIENKLNL